MNKPFRYRKSTTRRSTGYTSPERLTTFKLIFDAVCYELAIPCDDAVERELLATRIMAAGKTVESEMILVTTAMEAVADHRQKKHSAVKAKSMEDSSLESQAGYAPAIAPHTGP